MGVKSLRNMLLEGIFEANKVLADKDEYRHNLIYRGMQATYLVKADDPKVLAAAEARLAELVAASAAKAAAGAGAGAGASAESIATNLHELADTLARSAMEHENSNGIHAHPGFVPDNFA